MNERLEELKQWAEKISVIDYYLNEIQKGRITQADAMEFIAVCLAREVNTLKETITYWSKESE